MSNTETKTTTASATAAHTAAPANPFAAFASFDPMAMWSTTQTAFHTMVADAVARAEAFAAQFAAIETQMIGRAQGAVANWAQLASDAIAYSAQLSAEARKIGLETARHAAAKV